LLGVSLGPLHGIWFPKKANLEPVQGHPQINHKEAISRQRHESIN
jgi:hypothetical protein